MNLENSGCLSLIPGGLRLKVAIGYCTSSVLGKQPLQQRSSAGRWLLQQQLPGAWAWKLCRKMKRIIHELHIVYRNCLLLIHYFPQLFDDDMMYSYYLLYPACPLRMILFQSLLWGKCMPVSTRFKYCPGTTCGTVVPHSAKPPVSSKTSVAFQHSWRTNTWQSQCLFGHATQCQSILECGDVGLIHLQLFIDRFIHPNDHGHGTWGIRTTTKSLQLVSGLPDGHVQATNLHRACPAEGTFIVLEMQPVRWWNSQLICG